MLQPTFSAKTTQITLTATGDIYAEDTVATRELARRVRACVNACAGFTTAELEKGIVEQMRHVIQQLAPLAKTAEGERAA